MTVSASAATITYDFDDGTLQSWTNVLTNTVPSRPTQFDVNDGTVNTLTPQSGSFAVGPEPFVSQDADHETLVLRSPQFQLLSIGSISLYVGIGMGSAATPGPDFASLPATSSASGFEGVALRRVSDGAYVLSVRRSSNAVNWEQLTFSNAAIVGNGLVGIPLTLDLIDQFEGSYGWVGLDSVEITVPEPSATMLLALGGALAIRRGKHT